jgi:CRAL/TRIO domain
MYREGRPVIHFKPALERPPFDINAMKKLLVYTLERALQAMPQHQSRFAVVVDCEGFGIGTLPPVAFVKEVRF